MKRTPMIIFVAVAGILLFAAGPSHAAMRKAAQSTPAATAVSSPKVDLGPLVVTGQRLHTVPLPVKLQILKAALNRPGNFRHENLSKLVCRFNDGDSHGAMHQQLHCETNCDSLKAENAFAGFFTNCDVGENAQFNERLAAFFNSLRVNRAVVKGLLKRLPPSGSSYTLQVKSHGKVVARWIIENGQVTKIEVRKKDKH